MNWIEHPCVFCVLVPEDVADPVKGSLSPEEVLLRALEETRPRDAWIFLPVGSSLFLEAVDLTVARLIRETPADRVTVRLLDRNLGIFEIAILDSPAPPGRKHLRVVRCLLADATPE